MAAYKGTKALPGTGKTAARDRDAVASSALIQARLNDTTRRKSLEKRYGTDEVSANVAQLRGEGASGRRQANSKRMVSKAKGGSVSKRGDGIARKGKTRGKVC